VTPAHDPNDFRDRAETHLPKLTILDETAHVLLPGSAYHGLDRFAAAREDRRRPEGERPSSRT